MKNCLDFSRPLLLDGATGTNLTLAGLPGGVCPEKWILENTQALLDLQRRFVSAGSKGIYAPTFGANREKLEKYGLANQIETFNRQLVALSREANPEGFVAGDMTSLGLFGPPAGDTDFESLYEIYREQASYLQESHVDFFAIETITALRDARAAVLACRNVSDKPIIVTMTVNKAGYTMDGTYAPAAAVVLESMGVDAFGLNCSYGPEDMLSILKKICQVSSLPLVCKPNAGLPRQEGGRTVFDLSPEDLASYVPEMVKAGVTVFGGCCGTTPEHIYAIAQALEGVALPQKVTKKLPLSCSSGIFEEIGKLSYDYLSPDEIEESAMEAEPEEVIAVAVKEQKELPLLEESFFMVRNPVLLSATTPELLERALRLYQGRAMIKAEFDTTKLESIYGALKI